MIINKDSLFFTLKNEINNQIIFIESLTQLNDQQLNFRLNDNSWSILECIEHLNRYNQYYVAQIECKLKITADNNIDIYKSGLLGNYFANSMLPKDKLNKMKTFQKMNPIHSKLNRHIMTDFIDYNKQLLNLLESSYKKDINKIKIPITISKWIKIRLGDTFRFVINHNIRHIHQIKNIIEQLNKKKETIKVLKHLIHTI